jgi:hypothetical protein
MPTTTSLLAFVAQGLRVAALFNRPITSALDQINANRHFFGLSLDVRKKIDRFVEPDVDFKNPPRALTGCQSSR